MSLVRSLTDLSPAVSGMFRSLYLTTEEALKKYNCQALKDDLKNKRQLMSLITINSQILRYTIWNIIHLFKLVETLGVLIHVWQYSVFLYSVWIDMLYMSIQQIWTWPWPVLSPGGLDRCAKIEMNGKLFSSLEVFNEWNEMNIQLDYLSDKVWADVLLHLVPGTFHCCWNWGFTIMPYRFQH